VTTPRVFLRTATGAILLIAALAAVALCTPIWKRISPRSGCPLVAWIVPIDQTTILPQDYIELHSSAIGPTEFEPIVVRIYASGRVERETQETIRGETFGCPLHEPEKTINISPISAKALLTRARDEGFCRICDEYEKVGVMDGGVEEIRLSLHGKVKSVWDHNGNPPPIFGELDREIWELSEIEALADTRKFSPERKAECQKIEEERLHP